MGIPRFYRLITEQFPTVSQHVSFKNGFNCENLIDNLYLDANGILHDCSRTIYFPPEKVGVKKPAKMTPKKQEQLVFETICKYMHQLLEFVNPQKLFYIAIDGVAPLAKQTQQRQRRYKSSLEKSDKEIAIFDSTSITPGTKFMEDLANYIKKYIKKMKKNDSNWKNIEIIFSDSNEPGEGEHKIVNYIRKLEDKVSLVHCMYGLDADLFMLSLSTHCPNFYLLREDQFNTVWDDTLFYKVDISLLRTELFNYWGSIGGSTESLIDDFIFICFLIGNDFLHSLPCCHNLKKSINFLMDNRKNIFGCSYITNGNSFNLTNFLKLLKNTSLTEESEISTLFFNQKFPNLTLNSSLKDFSKPRKGINLKIYRELYYKKIGIDHTDKNTVHIFCKNYLQGLEWVQYYYHSEPQNWCWFYPYHYSPLVVDLIDYLENSEKNTKLTRVSNKVFKPILPLQQLLCVVPPKSKALLPPNIQQAFLEIIKKYYPENCKMDYEGKSYAWEAIALLPFIDLSEIIDLYKGHA